MFYSNLWIAINATLQVAQTQFLLQGSLEWSASLGFVFFGTLFLYALHRISGLEQVAPFTAEGRYKVISRRKKHIRIYAIAGLVGAGVFYLLFPWRIKWMLLLPGLLALGYVLPLGPTGLRLRDFHFVKIFLIALVWAWITVWLPSAEAGRGFDRTVLLMGLERAAFIFAITIPFDIRDLVIDRHTSVKTLPGVMGVPLAIGLSAGLLAVMTFCVLLNNYTPGEEAGLLASAAISLILVLYATRVQHDYYYTGLLDGMMAFQFLLVWTSVKWIFSA